MVIRALSSSEMVSGCQDSRGGINVTQTRYNLTLYVNNLFSACPYFQQILLRTYK